MCRNFGSGANLSLRDSHKECLAAYAVHFLVFVVPVYAVRAVMAAKGLPPPCPPGYVEAGQGPVDWRPLNPLVFYDAVHYLFIAGSGYDTVYRTAWFPLYPLLVRLFGGTAAAAVFVSSAAFLFALLAAYRLGGRASVWALALGPLGMLANAVYSESLFLAITGWALVFLEERKHFGAAALLGLGCLCRPTGWAVLAGAALHLFFSRGGLRTAPAVLIPAALAGAVYPFYLWCKFGDPLAFTTAIGYHGRVFKMPLVGLAGDIAGIFSCDPFWEAWRGVVLFNLAGIFYLAAAVLAKPWLSLPYALFVLSAGVTGGRLPYTHGFLRYAAGFFPWCLSVKEGKTATWPVFIGAFMGIVVSFLLFMKSFIF